VGLKHAKAVVVAGAVVALLAAGAVAVFEGYIVLFESPDPQSEPEAWPRGGATVQVLSPELSWPAEPGTNEWEIRVVQEDGPEVARLRARNESLVIPQGVLAPARRYRWSAHRVNFIGDADEEASWVARFATAEGASVQTASGKLSVFPATLLVGTESLVSGLSLQVEFPGETEVLLPPALVFPDGTRAAHGQGAWIAFPRLDLAKAETDPDAWGAVRVRVVEGKSATAIAQAHPIIPFRSSFPDHPNPSRAEGPPQRTAWGSAPGPGDVPPQNALRMGLWSDGPADVLSVRLRPDPETLGGFEEAVRTQFDPFADAPSFANFSGGGLAELTRGTCLGIVLTVKLFFEHVEYGEKPGIDADALTPGDVVESMLSGRPLVFRSSLGFRDLAGKRTQFVTELMSALHLENLNPMNWSQAVRTVLNADDEDVEAAVCSDLKEGRRGVVAGFRLRKKVAKAGDELYSFALLDSGHAFLVYRGWRFEKATFLAVYDPNIEYMRSAPPQTLLLFADGERPAYFLAGNRDQAMVRFMTVTSSQAFALAGLAVGSATERIRALIDTARDFAEMFQ